MGLLEGKTAVVTGIGPGMGREIALGFAREGARLVIGARSTTATEETAARIRASGGIVETARVDLTDPASCKAIVERAIESFGGVDVVVQNGALIGGFKSVAEADLAEWRQLYEANCLSAVSLYQAALPSFKAKRDGRIVLINSGAGNHRAPVGLAPYAASKGALAALVRSIALEAGAYGVRCNGVHLGGVDGKNHRDWIEGVAAPAYGMTTEQYLEMRYDEYLPMRRIPTAAECAGAVLFLASDLSAAMTGQSISVNGGEWFAL